jgi:hypothetical protein
MWYRTLEHKGLSYGKRETVQCRHIVPVAPLTCVVRRELDFDRNDIVVSCVLVMDNVGNTQGGHVTKRAY